MAETFHDFAATGVGAVQTIQVVISIDMRAGLQPDDDAEALGMFERKVKRDVAADRAADQDRPIKLERGHAFEVSKIMAVQRVEVNS